MWRLDVDGLPSPELSRVKEATVASFFCGAIWGAYTHSQRIMKIFLEKNKHEVHGALSHPGLWIRIRCSADPDPAAFLCGFGFNLRNFVTNYLTYDL